MEFRQRQLCCSIDDMTMTIIISSLNTAAKFSRETYLVHISSYVNFSAKLRGEPEFVWRSRGVKLRDFNFSAEFRGETELVHRSRDVNFSVEFSG